MRLPAYLTAIALLLLLTAAPAGFDLAKPAQAAEISEHNEDEATAEAENESEDQEDDAEATLLNLKGFIEFQSFLNTYRDQNFTAANKKNELRARMESKIGADDLHLFMAADLSYQFQFWKEGLDKDYRYAADARVKRNLRITSQDFEAAFNELYLNISREGYRLRMGNQIYSWGTADGINATAYFNPYDLREFVFRDDDEFRYGVPSLSAMLFGNDYTLEAVFAPVHIPMQLAPENNFWSLRQDEILYRIHFAESDGINVEPGNFAYGARLSTSLKGNDFSFSAYHGPDREPVLVPEAVKVRPNQPVSVNIEQQYFVVDYIGLDFSRTMGDLVIQGEIAYSPDKPNIIEQNKPFMQVRFPYQVERSSYVSYAVGFNYFIPLHRLLEGHDGESVFTFEWFQSKFFKKGVSQPYLFSDLLTFRYEDTFYRGHIPVSVTTLLSTRNGGRLFRPKIGWDFQNGMSLELSYAGISGEKDVHELLQNSFYYYRNNDLVMMNLRYEY